MTPTQLLNISKPVQLLDVRLSDEYEACHLAGAKNNCIHEVTFVGKLAGTAPDKTLTTVVYGMNLTGQEAAAAFSKLLRAGYSDAHVLEGGLEAAIFANLPTVEGEPLVSTASISDGVYPVDTSGSQVRWTGRNLINHHSGTIPLKSGVLRIENGELSTAEFALDLLKIECADLKGDDLHDVLIAHLHDDDFFDVENYPEAVFAITKVDKIEAAKPGALDLEIIGRLTLKGQTHPVSFQAASGVTADGRPAAQAVLSIDRTRWGVLYGSEKFFHRLAGHLVNDLIELEIKIVGAAKPI